MAAALTQDLVDHPHVVGKVYPGDEVQAVDTDDWPLPAGTEGILRIRSDLCADRYLDDPVASAEVFRNGWFYPGDQGAVSADGRLDVTGRVTEVINHGGDKISPHAIESVLLAQPGVVDAAAFGVPDAEGMMEIWAAVVVEPRFEEDPFRRARGERLRAHAPKFFFMLNVLPRNAGGKVMREELVKLVLAKRQPA